MGLKDPSNPGLKEQKLKDNLNKKYRNDSVGTLF